MPPSDSPLVIEGPDFSLESEAMARGLVHVCGVDEAGRGPLCGPVVAAAVILDPARLPHGLNDSKKLNARKRDTLFAEIMASAQVGIGIAPPLLIDRLNIRGATLWAMRRAVAVLPIVPGHALIDGRDVPPGLCCPGEAVIKGDGRSASIAAASIVAKVTRDRMCATIETDAPGFGISGHKGYPAPRHFEALDRLGPSRHHRMSFAPCRAAAR